MDTELVIRVVICGAVGLLAGPLLAALIAAAPHGQGAIGWPVVYGAGATMPARRRTALAACLVLIPLGLLPPSTIGVAVLVVLTAIVLTVIDLRLHRLPDIVVLPALAAVLVTAVVTGLAEARFDRLIPMLLTGAGLFVTFYVLALTAPSALGFGDVKLAALVGLALGHLAPNLTLIWCALLAPAALVSILAERKIAPYKPAEGWKTQLAFGPVMLGALWLLYVVLACVNTVGTPIG